MIMRRPVTHWLPAFDSIDAGKDVECMRFDVITEKERNLETQFRFSKQFNAFVDDFDIVAVHYGGGSGIEIPYFIRLLQFGCKTRVRAEDRIADSLDGYHYKLLDHDAYWKTMDGRVFCTGMPYNTAESAMECFAEMAKRYEFPDTIKFQVLDDRYKYRPNGYIMTMVYSNR